ncbi:MAG: hypothetical protein NT072_02795, partial [Deltaproteobacteria bacterium]|nr:hypothetical protein [Deltaproteobacteria bacterium]
MEYREFKELIGQDLADIGQRHQSYSNDGIRFTHWVLENVFVLSDNDAKTNNYDGPKDGGLDGFFIDYNEDLVRLIQCKYSDNIEREARESFITLPHKLREPERIAETNPSIYECSTQFVECIKSNFSVYMTFVFVGANQPRYSDELNDLSETPRGKPRGILAQLEFKLRRPLRDIPMMRNIPLNHITSHA